MVPNMLAEVEKARRDFPQEWSHAHTGSARTHEFIMLLAKRLHAIDPAFGLNGKRGILTDLSQDAINFIGEGPGHDPVTGRPVTIIDVIQAAGGPDPKPQWAVINAPGAGAWVKPGAQAVTPPTPGPTPPVTGPTSQPYPSEHAWWNAVFTPAVVGNYAEKGRMFPDPNDASATLDGLQHWSRTAYDIGSGMTKEAALKKRIAELRTQLGLPPLP